MTNSSPPRGFMVAAPRSGSGKTTVTIGLLRALRNAGVRVAGAKCGPDYIDTAFHSAACGKASVNLDSWAMTPALIGRLATAAARDSDLLICEASMGLFDGVPGEPGRTGSSADVAAALGLPVILVLDVSGQSQSAGAIVKGCMSFDPRVTISGVILNRVGSERHLRLVSDGISRLGIPILGSLPKSDSIELPSRHLGLVQASETSDLEHRLSVIADFVTQHVQLDRIAGCAGSLAAAPDRRGRRRRCHRRDNALPSRMTMRSRLFIDISSRAGAAVAPRSGFSHRWRTKRPLTIATSAGCRAAIPSFMPGSWRRRTVFSGACDILRPASRCMASAAAT